MEGELRNKIIKTKLNKNKKNKKNVKDRDLINTFATNNRCLTT